MIGAAPPHPPYPNDYELPPGDPAPNVVGAEGGQMYVVFRLPRTFVVVDMRDQLVPTLNPVLWGLVAEQFFATR